MSVSKGRKTGEYDLRKTINYYKRKGWDVTRTEYKYKIPGINHWRKTDVFGADFIAMNGDRLIFGNVTTKSNVSKHIKKFGEFKFPKAKYCDCVMVGVFFWEKYEKHPEVRFL